MPIADYSQQLIFYWPSSVNLIPNKGGKIIILHETKIGTVMARFLDASATSAALINLIKNSNDYLFVVSPYIKMTTQFKNYLPGLATKNLDFMLIYRTDSKLDPVDEKFLRENRQIQVYTCDNLHAKCYLNENEGIISSLNLYEHSQVSNWEMGVFFDKNQDPDLYQNAVNELKLILQASKSKSIIAEQKPIRKVKFIPEKKGLLDKIFDATLGPETGFCIRCGNKLDLDPNRPLCPQCYTTWSKHANPSYRERYCHECGKQKQTSYEKPICYECFKSKYNKM